MDINETTLEKSWEMKTQNIIPCWTCKGSGIFKKEELVSYHNNDYEYYNIICHECGGEGRLLEIKYDVKIKVNIPNENSQYVDFTKSFHEKLNGRTVNDIYEISKNKD